MYRSELPIREAAIHSCPAAVPKFQAPKSSHPFLRKRQKLDSSGRGLLVQAVLQQDRRRQDNAVHADAASRPDARHQVSATTASADTYVPLNEAQDIISDVVDANSPTPPVLLKFLKSGQQELRFINYAINGSLLGISTLLAASQLIHPGIVASAPNIFGGLKELAQQGSQFYEYIVDVHPIATKAVISGTVYGLGDFTAQAYEGRSWKDFDSSRIIRSGLVGFLAHGPLSHLFYEKLDRFFIVSKYFDGGDAWFTPIPKILVDQTLFAASWNTLYYVLLGEGGIFTEDILRGMTVESQITFQAADGEPIVKRLDEVMVEAAFLEANFGSSLDSQSSFNNPLPLQSLPEIELDSEK